MEANGRDMELVQALLRDANRWNMWKSLLNSHIESCISLAKDLASDAISREVDLSHKPKGAEVLSVKARMAAITEKMQLHLKRVGEELEMRTERSIQLASFPAAVLSTVRSLLRFFHSFFTGIQFVVNSRRPPFY